MTIDIAQEFSRLRHFPRQLLLETTSHCNLNCSMCARQFNPRKWGTLDEAVARKVIDEVAEKAPQTRIWFCYFGEPLIRKRAGLFDRIRYAKSKGITHAVINTNGNLMDERAIRDMIDVGLDEVYVGIDATTPEIYDQTRRGGNFDRVVGNVHRLCELAGDNIKVTVQFGTYENNAHQAEDFKKYWAQYPVGVFVRKKLTWAGYLDDYVQSKDERWACPWIFDSINVFDTGDVPYCVCDWGNRSRRGNVATTSIFDIWQKSIFPFLVRHARRDWASLPEFCQQCRDWQTKPPKDPALLAKFAQSEIDE